MKKKRTNLQMLFAITVFLTSFLGSQLFAQERVLSGTVTDENTSEPLPGASIIIKGTSTGVITDLDGNFEISVSDGQTVVVSYVGYLSEDIAISGQTSIQVNLTPDLTELEDVVVIGYGTQKKIEVTGSVASVKSEEMTKIAASDFTKSLQGQVAGVSVTESSGRPGESANVQIRGLGSVTSAGGPLYVIDGIPFESSVMQSGEVYQRGPNIAAEDIESVDILKDGAAAAIYGTRASNGVILITTKQGKAGTTKVELSSYYGIQNITSGTPLMDTPEYIYVSQQKYEADAFNTPILRYRGDAMDSNTNFVDEVTKDNAAMHSHNLTISGGQDNLTFNFNTNYYKQDGILINSGYKRLTTRAKANFKKGKFDALVSFNTSNSTKEQEPWGLYEYAIFNGPYRDPLPDNLNEEKPEEIRIPGQNPDHVGFLARQVINDDIRTNRDYGLSSTLKYEIIPGLTYQLRLGYTKQHYLRKFHEPQLVVYQAGQDTPNEGGSRMAATVQKEYQSNAKVTMENVVNYARSFGLHDMTVTAGYTYEDTQFDSDIFAKTEFPNNDITSFDAGATPTTVGGMSQYNVLIGGLLRGQYDYADRYLFSASIRRDGSSKFGENNKFGYFPSVSVGWNISEESFLKGIAAISNLKLRGSYGEVGNEGIPPYLYSPYIYTNVNYPFGREGSDVVETGSIQRSFATPDVKWETNISKNIGVDLTMFGGKLGLNADVYQNTKRDMLLEVALPPSTGTVVPHDNTRFFQSKIANVGDMVNQGLELSTYYKYRSQQGLGVQVTGTFTKNENEVTSLGENLNEIALEDSKPVQWSAPDQQVTTYIRTGYAAGSFFLLETNGIIKDSATLGEVQTYLPTARMGDLIVIDQNGDSIINDNDRVYAGSPFPKFEAGFGIDVDYKGFDLNVRLFFSYGNKVYNGNKMYAYETDSHKDMYYAWTPQNPTSDIPAARVTGAHQNFLSNTDFYLEDGTYLRFRNISLGYTIPKTIFKDKLEQVRVYVTATNPFTITKYEGYDPEVGGNGLSTRGIDKGNYPITRKFLMGIQVKF